MKKFSLAVIIFFVAFCMYWAAGRSVMLKTLDTQFKSLELQDYGIDHKGLTAGGFPFLFRSALIEPGLASPRSIAKPWSIKTDKVTMQASVFNPLRWDVTHRGEARIDLRGPKGERWLFDVRPFSLDLETKVNFGGSLKSLKAELKRPQVQAVIGTLPPLVGLDSAQIDIRPQNGDLRYEVSFIDAFLEKDTLAKWQTAFGPKISTIDAVVLAKGLKSFSQADLQNWKTSGNLLGESWTVNWNGNVFTGDFDLTLTDTGFDGHLRAEVENLPEIINQFAAAGMFTQQQAGSLKIGTILLPKNSNGRQEITFNFRDGYMLLFGQQIYKF